MSPLPIPSQARGRHWCPRCRAMRDCIVLVGTTDWHTEQTCACRVCGHIVPRPACRPIPERPGHDRPDDAGERGSCDT